MPQVLYRPSNCPDFQKVSWGICVSVHQSWFLIAQIPSFRNITVRMLYRSACPIFPLLEESYCFSYVLLCCKHTSFICYALHATEMHVSPGKIIKTEILQHPWSLHFSLHFQQNLTCHSLQHPGYIYIFLFAHFDCFCRKGDHIKEYLISVRSILSLWWGTFFCFLGTTDLKSAAKIETFFYALEVLYYLYIFTQFFLLTLS